MLLMFLKTLAIVADPSSSSKLIAVVDFFHDAHHLFELPAFTHVCL